MADHQRKIADGVKTSRPSKASRQAKKQYQKRKARAQAKTQAQRDAEAAQVVALAISNTRAAGIDIGKETHWVCVGFTDLSKFATVKHFCSWLGLRPQFKKTGGRVKSSRTRPGVNRCAAALRSNDGSIMFRCDKNATFLRSFRGSGDC